MTVVGTKLPILDVCSTAAVGGKADEICSGWVLLSLTRSPTAHPSAGRLLGAPA